MTIICARYGEAAYGVSKYCEDTPVDHVADAIDQVWNRWKRCPNTVNIAKTIGIRSQDLSNELEAIREIRDINNATDAHLENIGLIYGLPRNGFPDDIYRTFIKIKVFAQKSHGTSENIIQAAIFVRGGDTTQILFTPLFPAKFLLEFKQTFESLNEQALIASLLFLIKMGGVRMFLTFDPLVPFGFAGNPEASGFGIGGFSLLFTS